MAGFQWTRASRPPACARDGWSLGALNRFAVRTRLRSRCEASPWRSSAGSFRAEALWRSAARTVGPKEEVARLRSRPRDIAQARAIAAIASLRLKFTDRAMPQLPAVKRAGPADWPRLTATLTRRVSSASST